MASWHQTCCCEVGLEYKELVDRKTILLFPQIIYTKGIILKSFLSLSVYITRGIRTYTPDKADIALKSLGLILAPIPLPNTWIKWTPCSLSEYFPAFPIWNSKQRLSQPVVGSSLFSFA